MYNLLTEPLIRYKTIPGDVVAAILPQVYAALVADDVASFPALRPHQRHAWHAFLVQLGAMALHRAGKDGSDLPTDAGEWDAMIRDLTPDWPDDEPWQLVVEDITQPAFMQPPASSKDKEGDFKSAVVTPDELDILVTSKNHDLKAAMAAESSPDDWVFALVSLQTMEGYGGARNYGISRMPSGYGNRSAFSLTPSPNPSIHFRHDIKTSLKQRDLLLNEYDFSDTGISVVWTIPWDGRKAEKLAITDLDPFYIEVCRRVRLYAKAGAISSVRANSDDRRITDYKGLMGDLWMPVGNNSNPRGTPPAFLGPRRFNYDRVAQGLTSPDWKRPSLLDSSNISGDSYLFARGMVRGEGGTNGYHERIVPLRQRTLQVFGTPQGPSLLGDLSRERIDQAAIVQRALRYGIAVFASGGSDEGTSEEQRSRARPWADKLNVIIDETFFRDLQDELEEDQEEEKERKRREWASQIVSEAEELLEEAAASLPCRYVMRHRAKAASKRAFWGLLRSSNGIPDLLRPIGESEKEEQ